MSSADLSPTARRGLAKAAERAPLVSWAELRKYLATHWERGQHVSIFGPTGAGKTTVLTTLCGAPGHRPVVLVVTKHKDDLIRKLRQRGWKVCSTVDEVERAVDGGFVERWVRFKNPDEVAAEARVIFWPDTPESIRARRRELGKSIEDLLDYCYARGDITVALDEALYVAEDLKLGASLRACWHEGRSSGVSLLAASQRPSWLPKSAYSSPTFLVMFSTNDPDDLKRLGDIGGGLDPRMLRRELQLLSEHEFCFVAPRDRPPWVVRSTIPPPKKNAA